jgi:hypothetical protein
MMIAVPLAGEFNFYPFDDTFRVSLGTPVFFLFLLWKRGIHPNILGILTGMSVFVFRFLLAVGIQDISVEEAMYFLLRHVRIRISLDEIERTARSTVCDWVFRGNDRTFCKRIGNGDSFFLGKSGHILACH